MLYGKMIIILQGKKDDKVIVEKEFDYSGGPLAATGGRGLGPSELVKEYQKNHPDLEWSYIVKQ